MANIALAEEAAKEAPIETVYTKIEEKKGTWSKKERRILHLFAILGLINMLVYFGTQSSFVMQNIYWVYGIITTLDGFSLLVGLAMLDERKHKHDTIPSRYKGFLIIAGLWLISIPVVVIQYYYPVISISLIDVANFTWGLSIAISAGYDTLYVMVIAACWIGKGVEFK